jgi:hypothetical protein
MRRIVSGWAVLTVALALASPASAHELTIYGDWKIGSFLVKRDGTLAGAIAAFGKPASRVRDGLACTVRWPRHGLRIGFYNLGGANPCRGETGFFSNARAQGTHWQTNRGLEVGDRAWRVKHLYPDATFHTNPPSWWLVTRRSQIGLGGKYPGLLAAVLDRRVAYFQVQYPAGGD